jgi:hypothetical protein
VLVIVGDADTDALLKAADAAFGSWTAKGPAGTRQAPPTLAPRGLDAFTRSDPSVPVVATACRIAPLDGTARLEPGANAPRHAFPNLGDDPDRPHGLGHGQSGFDAAGRRPGGQPEPAGSAGHLPRGDAQSGQMA